MKMVGPIAKTKTNKIAATTMLILLKILIPLSSPDALEIMKQMVTMIIMTICVLMLLGIGVKWDHPVDVCIALNPNVVATPVHVASTARVSIVFPGMLLILFASIG